MKKITIIGALFTIVFGSFLHFLFEWSGDLSPVALIAAVNESTWEHLKLAFWPAFLFSVFEYFYYGKNIRNFFIAKALLLTIPSLLIVSLFYGYIAIFEDSLIFDISIFVISIIVGYWINYLILKSKKDYSNLNWLAYLIILASLAKFSIFTYFPLEYFIFQDPVSRGYGIIK